MAPFSEKILACLAPPETDGGTRLRFTGGVFHCPETGQDFPVVRGVPVFFQDPSGAQSSVTRRVKTFYEENPFPSYEGIETFGALVRKGSDNPFTVELLRAIGFNKLILDVGCGTGQLCHYLQLNNNHVLGIDASLASLRLAVEHKERNRLARVGFAQMNVFDMAVRDASFDVVISHGALHHTFDARRAFHEVARKVRPGGIVIVGLYNRFARIPTWVRSKLIKVIGPNLDYVVRTRIRDPEKARVWIADQYRNPHETWHSIDEVLGWFEKENIEFMNCSPPILGTDGEAVDSLFAPTDRGSRWERWVTQLSWLFTISREGALFDVVGRRRT